MAISLQGLGVLFGILLLIGQCPTHGLTVAWTSSWEDGCSNLIYPPIRVENAVGAVSIYSISLNFGPLGSSSPFSGTTSWSILSPYYPGEIVVVESPGGVACSCTHFSTSFQGTNMSSLPFSCSSGDNLVCELSVTVKRPPSVTSDLAAFVLQGCIDIGSGPVCTIGTCNTQRTVGINSPVVPTIPFTSTSPTTGTSTVSIASVDSDCLEDSDVITVTQGPLTGSRGGSLTFPSAMTGASSCLTDLFSSEHSLTVPTTDPLCPGETCSLDIPYSFDPTCASDPSANADFTQFVVPFDLPPNTAFSPDTTAIDVIRATGSSVQFSFLRDVNLVIPTFSCAASAPSLIVGDSVTLTYSVSFSSACAGDTATLQFNTAGVPVSDFSTPTFSGDCTSASSAITLAATAQTFNCEVTFNLLAVGSYDFNMTVTKQATSQQKTAECSITAVPASTSATPSVSISPSDDPPVSPTRSAAATRTPPSSKSASRASKTRSPSKNCKTKTRTPTPKCPTKPIRTPTRTPPGHGGHGGDDHFGDDHDDHFGDDHFPRDDPHVSASNMVGLSSIWIVAMFCSFYLALHL